MGFEVHFFKLIKRRILEGMPALWKVLPEDCFQSIPKGEKGNTPPKSNRQPENKSAWKQKTPFLSDFSIYHQFSGFYVKKLSLLGMWQGTPWLRHTLIETHRSESQISELLWCFWVALEAQKTVEAEECLFTWKYVWCPLNRGSFMDVMYICHLRKYQQKESHLQTLNQNNLSNWSFIISYHPEDDPHMPPKQMNSS